MFDVAIIGAGINGCATAYFLARAGLRVALIDKEGIASGGSGAAGAFISPKISKGGPLKAVMDEAYAYAIDFYESRFPHCFTAAPQLHIAKFDDENEKVEYFKHRTSIETAPIPESLQRLLQEDVKKFNAVFFKRSGIVDAGAMCRALAGGASYFRQEVTAVKRGDDGWLLGEIEAKHVVLATGAYRKIIDEPCIQLRGIWGHRIDIRTTTTIDAIIHHKVSLAPTDVNGCSAIGATHNVHYHPERSDQPYDVEQGRVELVEKATSTVKLEDVEILGDYTGLRSGSNDYMPILGRVVDSASTVAKYPELLDGAKLDGDHYLYYPDLYMINGTGGYGFVLAPYLASCLAMHLLEDKMIDAALEPSRFFTRWVKRAGKQEKR